MLAEERDQFRMDGHRAGFAGGRCSSSRRCRADALSVHQVPLRGSELREDQFAPPVVRQADEVVPAQVTGFLGPQRGVVHAAEEGHHPLTAFAVLPDRSK